MVVIILPLILLMPLLLMIDVHLISNKNNPRQWEIDCINSIPSWVTLHKFNQDDRSVGENRFKGFQLGDHEYVSFVDGDDIVYEGAFEICKSYLDSHPNVDMVGTLEDALKDGVITKTKIEIQKDWLRGKSHKGFHHLCVFRRSTLNKYLGILLTVKKLNEKVLLKEMQEDGCEFELLPFIGYRWRIHENGIHYQWINK